MKFRTTLQLALAALILGGITWFVDNRIESGVPGKQPGTRLIQASLDHVSYLVIEREDVLIDCRRENGRWQLRSPMEARADEARVERILAALEILSRQETITVEDLALRELSPADYGLAEPRMRVRFGHSGQKHELLVGNDAPPGKNVYVKLAWSGDVIVTTDELLEAAPASVAGLRDRSILDGDPDRVVKFEIHRPAAGYVQMTRQDGNWNIQQPFVARADGGVVERLLKALYSATVQTFVWDPGIQPEERTPGESVALEPGLRTEAYGLAPDEAAARISVWLKGDEFGRELMLGKRSSEESDEIYARLRDSHSVFTVSKALLDEFARPVVELRDRRLFAMPPADVRYACFEADGAKLILERDDQEGWRISEPLQRLADDRTVKSMINEITKITVTGFVSEDATNLVRYGLAAPASSIHLSEQSVAKEAPEGDAPAPEAAAVDQLPRKLLIGAVADNEGNTYAKFNENGTVFSLPGNAIARLGIFPLDPMLFLDRTVLSVLPDTVKRVAIKKNGIEQSAVKDDAERWQPENPEQGRLDIEALEDLFFMVANLRALRIVTYGPDNLAIYGLDNPILSVTLGLSGESGIQKSIMFGFRARTEGLYGMVQGQDVVFILASDVVDSLIADIVIGAAP